MSDGRDERRADLERVAGWFRRESPEITGLDLGRIRQRAMVQASRSPSQSRGPASLAGLSQSLKGTFMRHGPRPLFTFFLLLGLVGVTAVSALGAAGQLPGQGPGLDAAATQYEDDDGGGGGGGGNGREDEEEPEPSGASFDPQSRTFNGQFVPFPGPTGAGPPAGATTPAPSLGRGSDHLQDCGIFNQNFVGNNVKLLNCAVATQVALGNRDLTPDAACAQVGFVNDEPPDGFKRNDFAACVRAVELARAAADKVL